MNNPLLGQTKVPVVHQCGHSRMVSLFEGKSVETRIADLQGTDCPTCWLAKQPPTFCLRTAQSGRLAIDISRGYPIREHLRARGYRFQRPMWRIWFSREAERQEEILWLRANGVQEG